MESLKKPWPYIIAIVILAAMLLHTCNRNTHIKESRESEKEFLSDTIQYYKNEIGAEVSEKKALKGDKKSLQILLSKQIDSTRQLKQLVKNFRRVDAAGNITSETTIDSIYIPYPESVPVQFRKEWLKEDHYFSISGISTQNGTTIDKIQLPNTLSFAIGKRKTGLFSSEYSIEAVNSNPYIKTTGLDSYTFKVPQKRFGLGLYAGFGILENFTIVPQVGIGLNYFLLRF